MRLLMAVTVAILAVVVLYPIGQVILESVNVDGRFDLRLYGDLLRDGDNYTVLWNSLFVSISATIGATILGTFFAWIMARTDLPFKRIIHIFLMLPFVIPPFIGAIAWIQLLGPAGYLNKLYMSVMNTAEPLVSIYGPGGIIFVMILHSFPMAYICTVGPFERMSSVLEEAAYMSGAGKWRTMRNITLPIMMPQILAGALLVFVTEISNFGVPAILGFSSSYFVVTTKIYDLLQSFHLMNNLSMASALSVLLAVIVGFGMFMQYLFLRRKNFTLLSGKSDSLQMHNLGKWKGFWVGLIALFILAGSIAPVIAITLTALTKAYGLPPVSSNLSLKNFQYILFDYPLVRRAMKNSFLLAFGSATIAVMLGTVISYILVKTKMKGRQLLDFIAAMPYALPGTVIGLGMILAWARPLPFLNGSLYNTLWILLVAYVARYITFAVRPTHAALLQVDDSLEEAVRMSGGSAWRGFRDIVIPLLRPSMVAGWLLIFLPVLRELTISILLWSAGNETIGVAVFNLEQEGDMTSASALAMVMIVFVVIGQWFTYKLERGSTTGKEG